MDLRQALLSSRVFGEIVNQEPGHGLVDVGVPALRVTGQFQVRVDREARDWPRQTSILCWHCCHPFSNPPIPKPVGFDDRRRVFRVQGCFCSWRCAAAGCKTLRETGYLNQLYKQVVGRPGGVKPALPKCMLQAFGGSMTIEQFRAQTDELSVVPTRLVAVEGMNVQTNPVQKTRTTARLDLSQAASTNEVLKLRREKPLPAGRGLMAMHARITR